MRTGGLDVLVALVALILALGCSAPANKGPSPTIVSVSPSVAGLGPVYLSLTGTSLTVDGGQQSASIHVRRAEDLDGRPVGDAELALQQVSVSDEYATISLTVLPETPTGIYAVRVVRDDGQSVETPAFVRIPPPGPAQPDAPSVCMAPSPAKVGVSGSDFLVIDGVPPTVRLTFPQVPGHGVAPPTSLIPGVSACTRIPFGREDGGPGAPSIQRCSRMEIELPSDAPTPTLPPQSYRVEIVQPGYVGASLPASTLQLVLDGPQSFLLDLFRLLSAVDAPLEIALDAPSPDVWWSPPGWHRDEAAPPVAAIDGQPLALVTRGCIPTEFSGHSWCSQVVTTVPQGFAPGMHTLTITTTPGCTNTVHFRNTTKPVVTSIGPAPFCVPGGFPLTVTGTGFDDPRVSVGGQQLTSYTACSSPQDVCSLWLVPPNLPPGQYQVQVQNNSAPPVFADPSPILTIAPGAPSLGTPEPAVVYGGAERDIEVDVGAPLLGPITAAGLGPWYSLEIASPTPFTAFDGGVRLRMPAGTAPGIYGVAVTVGGICTGGEPSGWLQVTPDWTVMADDFDAGINLLEGLQVVWATVRSPGDPTILPTWQPDGGHPGGAVSFASDAGMPTWYFAFGPTFSVEGEDLWTLGFDLRVARSEGSMVTAPDIRILSNGVELQTSLPSAPGSTWQHFSIPLDTPAGWTFVDGSAARPATLTDIRQARDHGPQVWIRGQYRNGAGETWMDNLRLERHH